MKTCLIHFSLLVSTGLSFSVFAEESNDDTPLELEITVNGDSKIEKAKLKHPNGCKKVWLGMEKEEKKKMVLIHSSDNKSEGPCEGKLEEKLTHKE